MMSTVWKPLPAIRASAASWERNRYPYVLHATRSFTGGETRPLWRRSRLTACRTGASIRRHHELTRASPSPRRRRRQQPGAAEALRALLWPSESEAADAVRHVWIEHLLCHQALAGAGGVDGDRGSARRPARAVLVRSARPVVERESGGLHRDAPRVRAAGHS